MTRFLARFVTLLRRVARAAIPTACLLVGLHGDVYAQQQNQQALAGEADCEPESRITESFSNGAIWDFCWESRVRENLVLSDIHYTPPGGTPKRILSTAGLSQLHVAYDDSDVTYNDITQYGLGGGYMIELEQADCPGGQLLRVQTRAGICLWRTSGRQAYRTASREVFSEGLNLFSVSQVGAYAYIISWTFYADGAMEPSIGATGALQRSSTSTELPFGRVLDGDSQTLWLSHTHNYYWRLDFDLGSDANDDQVTESRHVLGADGRRQLQREVFVTEQARQTDPSSQTAWTVWSQPDDATGNSANSDGGIDRFGYLLEPIRHGHRFERKEVEPYTEYDFFVTVGSDCERFASQNARYNPDCLNNVLQYTDGQSLLQQDLVVWHRVAFHHVPRNEDQRHMHTHWDGFVLEPVDVLQGTSALAANADANNPPSLTGPLSLQNQPGDSVHAHFNATDADGDVLTYSAEGLPPGISLDIRGHLNGTTSTAGEYRVSVRVSDEHASDQQDIVWTVGQAKRRSGSASVFILLLLGCCLYRRHTALPDSINGQH